MLERVARDSLIGMVGAFIVWSAYFTAVYSILSIGCVRGLDQAALRLALIMLTLLTLAAIAYFGWRNATAARLTALMEGDAPQAPPAQFMALTAVLLAGLAFVATVWVALPLFFLPTCAG